MDESNFNFTGNEFNLDKIKEPYKSLTSGMYTHATPTLFNSGLKMQQLSSCFLIGMEDDSIEGIFNTIKDCALISKTAGGIGMHAHNIRGSGSRIKSTNGKSNGLIPFLKILMRLLNQLIKVEVKEKVLCSLLRTLARRH